MIVVQDPSRDGRSELQAVLDGILGRDDGAEQYYLVVLDHIDFLGNVKIKRKKLDFAHSGNGAATARTSVFPPELQTDCIYLPIVAGGDDGLPETWDHVGLAEIELSPNAKRSDGIAIVVERRDPDAVRFLEPRSATLPKQLEWQALWQQIPERVDRDASDQLDLVIAIELSGPRHEVLPRIDLADEITRLVDSDDHDKHRFGLIGYWDHQFTPSGEEPNVTEVSPIGPFRTATRRLLTWREQMVSADGVSALEQGLRQDCFAAPVEEMLQAALGLDWRDRAAHALVTLGARPAHPATMTPDRAMRCPNGVDWEQLCKTLKKDKRLCYYAVRNDPPWPRAGRTLDVESSLLHRLETMWESLGAGAPEKSTEWKSEGYARGLSDRLLESLSKPKSIPLAREGR